MRRWLLWVPLGLAACASEPSAGGGAVDGGRVADAPADEPTVLVVQPPVEDSLVGRGFYSHEAPGRARNYAHADDFRLDRPAQLHAIVWWGLAEPAEPDAFENFTHFTVRLFAAGEDGAPGALQLERQVAWASTSPRPTGRRATVLEERALGAEQEHELTLQAPLPLDAQTTYFLSITAHRRDPEGPTWMWGDGASNNDRTWSRPLDTDAWVAIDDTDSSFRLLGRWSAPNP